MAGDGTGLQNNVALPGSGDTPRENAENRFARTYLLFAADEEDESVLANFITHAEFIEDQLDSVESIDDEGWVGFLKSLEGEHQSMKEHAAIPAWNYDQFACLDMNLRHGTAKDGFSAREITDLYVSFVEDLSAAGSIDDPFDIGGAD